MQMNMNAYLRNYENSIQDKCGISDRKGENHCEDMGNRDYR